MMHVLQPHAVERRGEDVGPLRFVELEDERTRHPSGENTASRSQTPAGCWGEVHELGGAAVFLATTASSAGNRRIPHEDGTSRSACRPGKCREI